MKVQIYIETTATKHIGEIEIDSWDEYYDKAEELWEKSGYDSPTLNYYNDFDISDWDICELEGVIEE